MAKNSSLVLLGYEDDAVNEKQKNFLDFTTNKIGGKPNWPNNEIAVTVCPICSLHRPLIVQIYAPLENSQFHRTLYIFACVNTACSSQSRSWVCIRVQQLEKQIERDGSNMKTRTPKTNNINWCSGGDEWDDDFDGEDSFTSSQVQMEQNENMNEQNGNVVCSNIRSNQRDNRHMSDEEEESVSMDSDPIPSFGNLQVIDDKNANCGAQGGAAAIVTGPSAFAEIEGEESELVTIDAPTVPERDLIAMLKQTTAIPTDVENLTLKSFYVSVDEERQNSSRAQNAFNDVHIRELLQEYQKTEEKSSQSPSSPGSIAGNAAIGDNDEKYEKTAPMHGDIMFHNYLERIQENPGQIIRYSRTALPLLIAPLNEPIPKCQNCGNELICEIQILSTVISKLYFIRGEPCPIEFGNALVFTCAKSCWDTPDKMRFEHVIVQKEI